MEKISNPKRLLDPSSSPLGGAKSCTFTNPVRSTNYYFKLFTKDTTGNYSTGVVTSVAALYILPPNAGTLVLDAELFYGGTTTRSGGTVSGGGGSDTGTSTATTTTSTTTPGQGGGGSGDSGFLYHGSDLAEANSATSGGFFLKLFGLLTGVSSSPRQDLREISNPSPLPTLSFGDYMSRLFFGGSNSTYASTDSSTRGAVSENETTQVASSCSLSFFGICIAGNVPGMEK